MPSWKMLPVGSVWSQPRSTIVRSSACRLLLGIPRRVESWSWVPGPWAAISSRRSSARAADFTGPAPATPVGSRRSSFCSGMFVLL
jgi:hypothetical protein